ncbi:MAG: hypothetical protein ACK4GO_17580 [Gemmobacter sp.]
MTPRIDIPAHEAPTLRLFTLALPREDIRRMAAHHDRAGWLASMLGVPTLDPAQVETFDLADLGALGIAGYLAEAHGIPEALLAPDLARLGALTGPVLILRSAAFGGRAARLDPRAVLSLVATYPEDAPPLARFDALPSEGAKGTVTAPDRPPRSAAATGGMVATIALLVMFALTALVIWIGG